MYKVVKARELDHVCVTVTGVTAVISGRFVWRAQQYITVGSSCKMVMRHSWDTRSTGVGKTVLWRAAWDTRNDGTGKTVLWREI